MCTILDLPPEVLADITRANPFSASLTCKYLRAVALPQLFINLEFNKVDTWNLARLIGFANVFVNTTAPPAKTVSAKTVFLRKQLAILLPWLKSRPKHGENSEIEQRWERELPKLLSYNTSITIHGAPKMVQQLSPPQINGTNDMHEQILQHIQIFYFLTTKVSAKYTKTLPGFSVDMSHRTRKLCRAMKVERAIQKKSNLSWWDSFVAMEVYETAQGAYFSLFCLLVRLLPKTPNVVLRDMAQTQTVLISLFANTRLTSLHLHDCGHKLKKLKAEENKTLMEGFASLIELEITVSKSAVFDDSIMGTIFGSALNLKRLTMDVESRSIDFPSNLSLPQVVCLAVSLETTARSLPNVWEAPSLESFTGSYNLLNKLRPQYMQNLISLDILDAIYHLEAQRLLAQCVHLKDLKLCLAITLFSKNASSLLQEIAAQCPLSLVRLEVGCQREHSPYWVGGIKTKWCSTIRLPRLESVDLRDFYAQRSAIFNTDLLDSSYDTVVAQVTKMRQSFPRLQTYCHHLLIDEDASGLVVTRREF